MDIPPSGGRNGGGGTAGGGDIRLPLEHSHTVYCDQAYYVPVSGGGANTGATGLLEVVGARQSGRGGDTDSGSGVGTDGGGGGDRKDGNIDGRLIRWEYTAANVILGMEPNDPLAYAPGLEFHHQIMSMLGGNGGWLEIYIYIYIC